MTDIARRAVETDEPISRLVEEFYGPDGPLAKAGWSIRPQQREMSMDAARALDGIGLDPDRGAWLIEEAPCGVGKSLSYLLPGVLAALRAERQHAQAVEEARKKEVEPPKEPRKLVVSTANIALQEQIVRKDVPALGEMLGVDLRVALLKSKRNYVCRQKVRTLGSNDMFDATIEKIVNLVRDPDATGDREDLTFEVTNESWSRVSSSSEDCLGRACKHYNIIGETDVDGMPRPCLWRRATLGHQRAHVVVVNHAYLISNRGIPNVMLAVDEMHELEDFLRSSAEQTLLPGAGINLARRAARVIARPDDDGEGRAAKGIQAPIEAVVEALTDAATYANRTANGSENKYPKPYLLTPGWSRRLGPEREAEIMAGLDLLDETVEEVCRGAKALGGILLEPGRMVPANAGAENAEESARAARTYETACKVAARARAAIMGEAAEEWPGEPWALWAELETRGRGENKKTQAVAHMVPADVSWATGSLRANYRVALMTSATVPEFRSLRLTLGMGVAEEGDGAPKDVGKTILRSGTGDLGDDDETRPAEKIAHVPKPTQEKRLPSPYKLAEMGLLVVPDGPNPKEAGWKEWATDRVIDAVVGARGRTLVLCSSLSAMHEYTVKLRGAASMTNASWEVKKQGEMGRGQLRKWFTEDVNGVLVATRSFFQGLDVKGESCSCVVIDRVPFGRPDDPVENAVGTLLEDRARAAGAKAASAYDLRVQPEAAMALAQGAGRLIRSEADRGVVVMLDNRILGKGSWSKLRQALPPFPISRDIDDVRRFLDGEPVTAKAAATTRKTPQRARTVANGEFEF